MKISYPTPWKDSDTGETITAVEIERVRFPYDGLGMEAEFKLYNGDELVSRSTKALPVSDPELLQSALETLALNIESACKS
jgi:hypothetical protein